MGRRFKGTLNGQGFAAVTGAAPGPANVSFGKDPNDPWAESSFMGANPWPARAVGVIPAPVQALARTLHATANARANAVQDARQVVRAIGALARHLDDTVHAETSAPLRTPGASPAKEILPGSAPELEQPPTPALAKSLSG